MTEGDAKTTSLPYSFLLPLPVPFLLPLNGFLPFHLHHLIQSLLFCIQFFLDQLLFQDLGIPDGMALGIEDDLKSGNEIVALGLGVSLGRNAPRGCRSWRGEKWEQSTTQCAVNAHSSSQAQKSKNILNLSFALI